MQMTVQHVFTPESTEKSFFTGSQTMKQSAQRVLVIRKVRQVVPFPFLL